MLERLQNNLLPSTKQKGFLETWQPARVKKLELAPKTGFTLSTCTEVESRIGDAKKIAPGKIRFRDTVAIHA